MLPFSFPPYSLPAECEVLRGEVREFLEDIEPEDFA